ncbi:MAG TPA: hypothetical protein LFW10_03445 [Rickettsia endosymbiont of Diachasma alloeum]|nr:hypothetical protein [Rickettsia endosymbiont of Diachasma alloeum]
MLDLKSLNTILFSNKESELKIAIKKIREQFEPEEAKNILSYAKVYNEILNVNSLDIELNKPIKVINDEEIINK